VYADDTTLLLPQEGAAEPLLFSFSEAVASWPSGVVGPDKATCRIWELDHHQRIYPSVATTSNLLTILCILAVYNHHMGIVVQAWGDASVLLQPWCSVLSHRQTTRQRPSSSGACLTGINLSPCGRPSADWRHPPGRPPNRWLDQIRTDTGSAPATAWRNGIRRGHHPGATYQPQLATRQWWPSNYSINQYILAVLLLLLLLLLLLISQWTRRVKIKVKEVERRRGERVGACVSLQGGSKKVSCWHSTAAYFFEPPCITFCNCKSNCNWGTCIAPPPLEDRGRITESIRILVSINRTKQKCFQITTKRVCRSQQFQLRRQPVPCACSQCCNRKGSVANSSTCPRHLQDEVDTRWSAQCRSTWNIGNQCQKVRDVCRCVFQKRLVNQQAQLVLDPLSEWQPVQLSKSWSHTVTRLEIQNSACRCVQDSLERCQRGSWKTGQHGVAIIQTQQDKWCNYSVSQKKYPPKTFCNIFT